MCHTVTGFGFLVLGKLECVTGFGFFVFGIWFLESWNVSQDFGRQLKFLSNLNFAGKWSPWSHV